MLVIVLYRCSSINRDCAIEFLRVDNFSLEVFVRPTWDGRVAGSKIIVDVGCSVGFVNFISLVVSVTLVNIFL